ncbi:MAG: S41 family peptidase [Acidobacteriota bacterium]
MKNTNKNILLFSFLALAICGALIAPRFAAAQEAASARRISDDYQKAADIIRNKYVVDVDDETMSKVAIQGMLKSLDPHSDYYDPKSFKEFNDRQHSQYFGIGSLIRTANRVTYVAEPFKGSPASRAGLRFGDQIVGVNDTDTSTWTSDKVRTLLLGERGTTIKVSVKRLGVAEPISVNITRDGIWRPSIPNYYLVKPNIGYIGLTTNFQTTTSRELANAMADLREQGATSFILDLRGNGGGLLDQGIRVSDQFLQRGQKIVTTKSRPGVDFNQDEVARIGASENLPLVVLVDRQSASASEIVAGAIQDHDRGLIVGEQTFGKGLVQRIFPLVNGGALVLVIAHYYTPSGRLIQRDYSNGSIFEYYTRRDASGDARAAVKRTDERKTDLGRTVYGGGGIEPDVKVENPDFFLTSAQVRLQHATFLFTRDLVSGQVAVAPNFKLNGIEYDHKLKPNEFAITDDIIKAFREFAVKFYKDNPDYGLTPALIDANLNWARKQIRFEVLTAAYGTDRAQQGIAEYDLQLQKAITEMPEAAALTARSWKGNTANNRGK